LSRRHGHAGFLTRGACFLRREWPVIDRLRLDKYMVLVRRMLFHAFQFLATHGWCVRWKASSSLRAPPLLALHSPGALCCHHRRDELLLPVCEFLRVRLLLATDHGSSLGLALHVSDVLLAELSAAAAHTGCPLHALSSDTLLAVLQPFMAVLSTPGHATLAQRAVTAVFEPLIETLRDGADGEDAAPRLSLEQGKAVAQVLFDTASDPDTSSKHRSLLYQLSRRFKEAASDGPVEKRPRKAAAAQPTAQTPKPAPVAQDTAKRSGKKRDLLGGSIVVPTKESGLAEAQEDEWMAPAATPAEAPAGQRGTPKSGLTPVSGHSSAYETALSHGASGRSLDNGDGAPRAAPSTGKGRGGRTPSAALEGSFEDVWVTPPGSAGHAALQTTPRRTPGSGGGANATPAATPTSALASGKRKAQQQHQAAPAAATPGSGPALNSPAKRCVHS
jgi:ribosomal RNA-processing protein 1